MPGADFARVFGTILKKGEERAKADEDKASAIKQEDINMYRKVLLDPNATPEQRDRAAQQIGKLRGLKKDNPYQKISGLLNHIKGKQGQAQGQEGGNPPMSEKVPGQDKQLPPLAMPDKGATPAEKPSEKSNVGQDKKPQEGQPKKRGAAMQALGNMFSGKGLIPHKQQDIPPIDTSVFPQRQNDMLTYRKDLKEAVPNISDEQLDKAIETKFGAVAKQTVAGGTFTKKGSDLGSKIPEGEKDILGNPIDKNKSYDILENGRGEKQYISSASKKQIRTLADETGKPADFVVDINDPTKLIKVGVKAEQAEYKIFTDPETQEQYAKPVPRYVNRPGVKPEGGQKEKRELPSLYPQRAAVSKLKKMGGEVIADRSKGISLGKKDTSSIRAKAEQAVVVMNQGQALIDEINSAREALGPWKGRISNFEVGIGSADPIVRKLYTSLKSFAALQPALHGSRGIGMQKEFENASGKLADDPDSAIAAIQSLMETASRFAKVGGEGKNIPEGMSKPKNVDKEVEELENKLLKVK